MIILISGASHTGKTNLAQKLMRKYNYPYYSIDLLKMGLIRSKQTKLTPEDDNALQNYLWPIIREMIKTAIENKQNLIIEGGYIPFEWKRDFSKEELKEIKYYYLIMSEKYILNNFDNIKKYANVIETRIDDSWFTKAVALEENAYYLKMCKKYNYKYQLIDGEYEINLK